MTSPAVQWLLESDEPAIRRLARRDLLGERVEATPMDGPKVRGLLHGLDDEAVHPYEKWDGAHWRLVSLVELEVPADDKLTAAANTVVDWLTSDRHRSSIRAIGGLTRVHASQEGNALAVCCGLGMANDPRVVQLARDLVEWQRPDGGWNCDPRASGRRSSFHESLIPAHGLHEYAAATGDDRARQAASRTADLLLDHQLFRRTDTGEPIHEEWLRLHHPPFWHYDILHALVILTRMGRSGDPRAADALDVLRQRRLKDGRWRAGGSWVRGSQCGPNEMITLNALRVLAQAESR